MTVGGVGEVELFTDGQRPAPVEDLLGAESGDAVVDTGAG